MHVEYLKGLDSRQIPWVHQRWYTVFPLVTLIIHVVLGTDWTKGTWHERLMRHQVFQLHLQLTTYGVDIWRRSRSFISHGGKSHRAGSLWCSTLCWFGGLFKKTKNRILWFIGGNRCSHVFVTWLKKVWHCEAKIRSKYPVQDFVQPAQVVFCLQVLLLCVLHMFSSMV